MSVTDVIDIIDHHNNYMASKVGDTATSLLESFKTGLLHNIQQLPSLSPSDAAKLNTAIKASVYPERMKTELQHQVDQLVTQEMMKPKFDKKGQQLLKQVWHYPTQGDWNMLLDPKKSFTTKASTLVHRLNMIGLSNPSEETQRWMLSVLIMC